MWVKGSYCILQVFGNTPDSRLLYKQVRWHSAGLGILQIVSQVLEKDTVVAAQILAQAG